MEVPWKKTLCILCLLTKAQMTEEHIIPERIGGKLWVRFLCDSCNSRLGERVDAEVKKDPALQHAARTLAAQIPDLAARILEDQPYIAHGPGGMARGKLKSGNFSVDSSRTTDGFETSITQPTSEGRKHVATVVRRQSSVAVDAALKRFDEAPENQRVELAPGLAAIKWGIDRIEPAYDGPLFSEVALLKIAYEFLACHLGDLIYEESEVLTDIRRILTGAMEPRADVFTVEPLTTREYAPLHGIALVDGGPPAVVKVYLFGWLVFRVTLHRITVGPPHFRYICLLDTGEELFEPDERVTPSAATGSADEIT